MYDLVGYRTVTPTIFWWLHKLGKDWQNGRLMWKDLVRRS